MERGPPPSPPAAALAALDDVLMETPLSPKRPRQDEPPDQVGAGTVAPRPRIITNSATAASMLASSKHAGSSKHAAHPNTPPTATPTTCHNRRTLHQGRPQPQGLTGPYTAAVPPSCSCTRGWPGTIQDKSPMRESRTIAMQEPLWNSGPPKRWTGTPLGPEWGRLPPSYNAKGRGDSRPVSALETGQAARPRPTESNWTHKPQAQALTHEQGPAYGLSLIHI